MREYLQTQKECGAIGHEWEEAPGGSWCPNCEATLIIFDELGFYEHPDTTWGWELQELDEPDSRRLTMAIKRTGQPPRKSQSQ